MTKVDAGQHKPIDDLAAASAAASGNLLRASQSGVEGQLTLAQLATLIQGDLGTAVADDITVSSMTISSLTAAGSAMTFTATAGTDGTLGAASSGVNFSFSTKAEFEFLVETVKNNKTVLDELRS